MATYLIQFSYTSQAVRGMVEKPQDRRQVAEKIMSAAGGRLVDFYFSFGDYDGIVIAEFPSNVEAASAALGVGASGGFSKIKSTVLISTDEAVEAMKKAGQVGKVYQAPGS